MTAENAQKCYDGAKTMTRRIVKPQPISISWFEHQNGWCARVREDMGSAKEPAYVMVPCPYGQIGDRLWIRETFLYVNSGSRVIHKGDFESIEAAGIGALYGGWKPSIHMPRRACRTVLEITELRVERLQEITEEDSVAEGIEAIEKTRENGRKFFKSYRLSGDCSFCELTAKDSFKTLWESINGKGSWSANPWVWVIGFKKVNNA